MKPTDVKSSTCIELYVKNEYQNIKTFLQNVKSLIG